MEYKSGDVFLDGRKREMIANSILGTIERLSKIRNELNSLGVSNQIDWELSNYQAILKTLSEE